MWGSPRADLANHFLVTEPFDVVLEITNPLGTPLKLGNLTVGGGGWSSSLEEVEVQTVEELILDPGESREVSLYHALGGSPQH
jgi:hypothetical protein